MARIPNSHTRFKIQDSKYKIENGFTIVELLVVIAIIALLVAAILIYFKDVRAKSRDSRRKQDLKEIENAIANYQSNNNGSSPAVLSELVSEYISRVPQDPRTGNPYSYKASDNRVSYEINTNLEINDGSANNDGGNQPFPVYEKGNDLTLLP